MEAIEFFKMLSDKNFTNLRKMQYKYPDKFNEFVNLLNTSFYNKLPLKDFKGNNIVYLNNCTNINLQAFNFYILIKNHHLEIRQLKKKYWQPQKLKT